MHSKESNITSDSLQQVVEIQKRKEKLAEVTFKSAQLPEDGIGMGTLMVSWISYIITRLLMLIQYLKSVLE
jgi:hypothetical protein